MRSAIRCGRALKIANHTINRSKRWMQDAARRRRIWSKRRVEYLARSTSEVRLSAHSRVLLSRITLGENETLNWALIKCRSRCTPEILLSRIAREGIKFSSATFGDVCADELYRRESFVPTSSFSTNQRKNKDTLILFYFYTI